jgi:hypothetical protein
VRLTCRTVAVAMVAIVVLIGQGGVLADLGDIDAEASTPPATAPVQPVGAVAPPECWWEAAPATATALANAAATIATADGGAHAGEAIAFVHDGVVYITVFASQQTFVRQLRRCDDPAATEAGQVRWVPVAPPDPGVYLPALYERVSRLVPLPDPNISPAPDVLINVGLWIAVDNADDVVARAEPAAGIWAETRATLTRTEFDPGNGDPVVVCDGAGSPIPAGMDDDPRPGPCGYTYTRYSDLGTRTAIVRTTWEVTNRTSTGHFEQRAPIVRETTVALYVFEIQTVGAG